MAEAQAEEPFAQFTIAGYSFFCGCSSPKKGTSEVQQREDTTSAQSMTAFSNSGQQAPATQDLSFAHAVTVPSLTRAVTWEEQTAPAVNRMAREALLPSQVPIVQPRAATAAVPMVQQARVLQATGSVAAAPGVHRLPDSQMFQSASVVPYRQIPSSHLSTVASLAAPAALKANELLTMRTPSVIKTRGSFLEPAPEESPKPISVRLVAASAAHPDFSGIWTLTGVDGDIDAIFDKLGIGQLTRKYRVMREGYELGARRTVEYHGGDIVVMNGDDHRNVLSLGESMDQSNPPRKRRIAWEEDGRVLSIHILDSPPEKWRWHLLDAVTKRVEWSCEDVTVDMIYKRLGGRHVPKAAVAATSHPDFSGSWIMEEVTGDVDGVLMKMGVGYSQRNAARLAGYGQGQMKTVEYRDDKIVVYLNGTEDVHVIGEGQDLSNPPNKRVIRWEEEGQVLSMDILGMPVENWKWRLFDSNTQHISWSIGDTTCVQVWRRFHGASMAPAVYIDRTI